MRGNLRLNGCDYLMLGFDHELRARGFAGNSCQIVLKLGVTLPPAALQRRLSKLQERYSVMAARPGGVISPHWKLPRGSAPAPQVRVHAAPAACGRLFNEPLAVNRGELMRFDLVEREGGGTNLIFTWAHALMDALSAEHFLALVGREELPLPGPDAPVQESRRAKLGLKAKFQLAWKNLHQLDQFCQAAPRSPGVRHPGAPAMLNYHVQTFSAAETARVRANGARCCGILGDAQFHAAVSVMELHRLHERLGCPSPSYVLPVPVGLRPKGAVEPLFSNQVAMLMHQFLPKQLDTIGNAVCALKTQTEQGMRAGLLDSGLMLSEMFRFLPLPVYMAVLKRGLRGEICSLFYGDTAAVSPLLTSFLDAPIEDFIHVAAVTPSPGVGVIFYYFRGTLRVTVLHLTTVLNDEEAAGFGAGLRARLLDP